MKFACLPLIALLAACSQASEEPVPVANETAPEMEAEAPAPPQIEGRWEVASYRNAPLPASAAMRASASESELTVSSSCANMRWSYEQNGNMIRFTPVSGLSGGCAADPTSFENGVAQAIGDANIVMDMGGRLQLSGPGGVVDLQAL
ncbi:META domain-containing protein [Sphingomicrobium lutaoense]|uniref:META domain-containing protein n=1 Tax=Sphingomicrobium lutaoense TaxID=515949 RepID=A0A839Z0E5_9SPHN|nr:META domain-containing protein [Sphingomicrobium lutaoense]MBB3764829.1 hypothetical protein [Sphingomicrobium lutaoense]